MAEERENALQRAEQPEEPTTRELFEKAQRYEDFADQLLRYGDALEEPEVDVSLDDPYSEQSPLRKFKLLSEVYTDGQRMAEEMIENVSEMMQNPESYDSSQLEKKVGARDIEYSELDDFELPEEYPKVSSREVRSHRTGRNRGEPEMRKVTRRLETEEQGEWIEMSLVESKDAS